MLLVPEASVPPVLMCCESSAAGIRAYEEPGIQKVEYSFLS